MIKDYLRRPNRYGAGRYENPNDPYHESGRRPGSTSRRDIDWDRWPDAEALRWSPRSGQRDEDFGAPHYDNPRDHEEGYGYGDPYFGDDPRARRPAQPRSALDELFGDEGADERYRRPGAYHGPHRGLGPHGYRRSDERIREDVCERLTDHPAVDARNLEVAVENGVVLLQGTVSERVMKYCAEDCSGRVSGVKDVDNRLHVDRPSH